MGVAAQAFAQGTANVVLQRSLSSNADWITPIHLAYGNTIDLQGGALITSDAADPTGFGYQTSSGSVEYGMQAVMDAVVDGSGFNNGGAYWANTSGIVSSTAAGDTNNFLTVGYLDNALANYPTWRGRDVSSAAGQSSVLIGTTYYGDLNMDGQVDLSDFSIWGTNIDTTGGGWVGGDIDMNGVTDLGDFAIWGTLYADNVPPLNFLDGPGVFPNTTNTSSASLSPVPEPATGVLLFVGFLSLAVAWRGRTRRSSDLS
jgi:hypothetical protein